MDVISKLIARACEEKQRIVLPEGTEERTLKAADKAIADGIAELNLGLQISKTPTSSIPMTTPTLRSTQTCSMN